MDRIDVWSQLANDVARAERLLERADDLESMSAKSSTRNDKDAAAAQATLFQPVLHNSVPMMVVRGCVANNNRCVCRCCRCKI